MELAIVLTLLLLPFVVFTAGLSWAVHQTNVAEREKAQLAAESATAAGPTPHQPLLAA